MKLRTLSLTLLILVFLQAPLFAANGRSIYNDYRNMEKRMEKTFKTFILVQEQKMGGTVTEAKVYMKGKKSRIESVIKKSDNPMLGKAGQKSIIISDGVTTTAFSPMLGKMTTPSPNDKEYIDTVVTATFLGKETVAGVKCNKIKVTDDSGNPTTLWISRKDSTKMKEKDIDTTIVYSDFRKIEGFLMPYVTKSYEGGSISMSTKIKSIKVNKRLANTLFDASKVKGFKSQQVPSFGQNNPSQNSDPSQQMGQAMNMMQMAMQIQALRQQGENDKADALQKKMQAMMGQ